jgi:uncharacterized membrane-anchored protein YitT (DUF2179 family)
LAIYGWAIVYQITGGTLAPRLVGPNIGPRRTGAATAGPSGVAPIPKERYGYDLLGFIDKKITPKQLVGLNPTESAMKIKGRHYTFSIPYNILLITIGSIIYGIGLNAIAMPHGLISGGFSGLSLLIYYWTGRLSPGVIYFILNIPIFILGWRFVSRRFFGYSLIGMIVLTLSIDLLRLSFSVQDPMLAVLAGGCLIGAGSGIILHSLGSAGGTDIIAIILNQRFNLRIGTFFFIFNVALFAFSLGHLPVDLVLYSLAMSFVTSQVIDYVLNISNQRKLALIVSNKSDHIASEIIKRLERGVTLLQGRGAYSGQNKQVVMTVIHNYQLKRLEELVFDIDDQAFVIFENTLNVLGAGFSTRKTY